MGTNEDQELGKRLTTEDTERTEIGKGTGPGIGSIRTNEAMTEWEADRRLDCSSVFVARVAKTLAELLIG